MRTIYNKLKEELEKDKALVLVTKLAEDQIAKYFLGAPAMPPGAEQCGREAMNKKNIVLRQDGGETFVAEPFFPEPKLVILGGGHVGYALYQLAVLTDLPVEVADDRPSFASPERFPAARGVFCGEFPGILRELTFSPTTMVVAATRGHASDRDCLEKLLPLPLGFLGMVGSRSRSKALRQYFIERGFAEEQVNRLVSPVGLPIAASTPAEIALSIMAQLVEIRRTRLLPGESLDPHVLEELIRGKGPGVLVTVVRSLGSSPRKEGAKMVVYPDGQTVGTIGGGCGEAEVRREALTLLDEGKPGKIYRLDLTDDAAAEAGMACGGKMDLLLERF